MKPAAALLLLVLPFLAWSDDTNTRSVDLSVKPLLCIVDERTPGCDMSFLVRWRSNEVGYYCVFNSLEDNALNCWAEQQSGELRDDRTIRDNLVFWISETEGTPLESITVEVLRMDSDDRRRRRRSRHVWDLL